MSIEYELSNLLSKNGFYKKQTKIGPIWTHDHQIFKVFNFHNNGTASFNYLGKYMRDMVKANRGAILDLTPQEKENLYREDLSNLKFYKYFENNINFRLRASGSDYVHISDRVGMNVFNEVVEFIVSQQ